MLRKSFAVAVLAASLPLTMLADELYIPIAGSVGNFRTDVRILNPSATKDITVTAFFLPSGNVANFLGDGVKITIPKMQMVAYDDIVSTLFSASGVGAIYLAADFTDRYLATARIYADTAAGTLGQAFVAPSISHLMRNGDLLQLRANSAFRTNIGAVNLQNSDVEVTWTLYDKNNAAVSSKTVAMPPYGVIAPTSITSGFFFDAGNADLTNAWVSFSSTGPIDAYASIVDNRTTDPTFIPAQQIFQ